MTGRIAALELKINLIVQQDESNPRDAHI